MASVTGPSDARFETTAAWQAAETSNVQLQSEVEKNAQKAHLAAEQAAKDAQFKAPSTSVAVDQLEQGLSHKTDQAVAQGQADVQSATATGAGYLQQAREVVGGAMATAASYLPSSIPGSTANTGTTATTTGTTATGPGVAATLQSAAGTAVETAKTVINSATQTAQPYVESAAQAAQPYVESAKATVQPHVDRLTGATTTASTTSTEPSLSKPAEVPATTAPLEGSGGVVGGVYPAKGTSGEPHVGQI